MTEDPIANLLAALMEEIRKERTKQGLNYEDLSAATGLHRTTFSLYDRGERGPSFEVLAQIANALNVPLSEFVRRAESNLRVQRVHESFTTKREVPIALFRNAQALREITGLSTESLRLTMRECYSTLDTIDTQLLAHGADPISRLVELANLSSMVGNLLAAGLAEASNGLYKRNKPHAYPDLIPQAAEYGELEIKVALETNKPKGHLPKAGTYLTFRYVLCDENGRFVRGKESRGTKVFIWEIKAGHIRERDFDVSNTAGDSGKTAVIKTRVFNAMPLVFFDPDFLPYGRKSDNYPGYN